MPPNAFPNVSDKAMKQSLGPSSWSPHFKFDQLDKLAASRGPARCPFEGSERPLLSAVHIKLPASAGSPS